MQRTTRRTIINPQRISCHDLRGITDASILRPRLYARYRQTYHCHSEKSGKFALHSWVILFQLFREFRGVFPWALERISYCCTPRQVQQPSASRFICEPLIWIQSATVVWVSREFPKRKVRLDYRRAQTKSPKRHIDSAGSLHRLRGQCFYFEAI